MFDIRTNAIAAMAASDDTVTDYSILADSYNDFKTTEKADADILSGRFPVTNYIMGIGDLRVVERKPFSWGYTTSKVELDVLLYTRAISATVEYRIDKALNSTLYKHQLSNSGEVLTCLVRQAESLTQIHDNIFKRRWIVEILIRDTTV